MVGYISFILRYRFAVLGLFVAITVAAAAVAGQAEMSTRLGEDMIGDRPEFDRYLERSREFRSDGLVVVAVEDPNMLNAGSQARLRKTVAALEELPYVAVVESILDASRMKNDGEALLLREYAAEALASPVERAATQAALCADPLLGSTLLSKDCRAHCVAVELVIDENRAAEAVPPIVDGIMGAFVDAGYPREQLHRTGFTAAVAETLIQLNFNLITVFPIVALVLLFVVWLLFRRFWPAAVAFAVAMLAVIWTVGFVVALYGTIHALVSLIPPVILIVAFSDTVHLCSAYLILVSRGRSKAQAIAETGAEVGKACLLTSATTFVGFASFGLVPQPAMRATAIAAAFGVGVALLIAITLVPVLLSFGRQPKPLHKGATGAVHGLLDRLLDSARRLSAAHPGIVIAAFGLLTVFAAAGAPRFTFDADFDKRFDAQNTLTIDSLWFKENFVGAYGLEVYVEAPAGKDLLDPERFRAVADYQRQLEAMPGVESAYSLVDLVEEIHRTMAPHKAELDPLPDNRPLLAQYLLLFESAGGDDLERIVDFERKVMVIGLKVKGSGARQISRLGIRADALTSKHLGDLATAESTGLVYLLGYFFDEIVNGQKLGFFVSFFLIALLMALGLRSLRAGFISMVPNLLPVLTLAGYMGFFVDHIDSDVMLIMIMAVGIGVDDTIHFLMRYRVEFDRNQDSDAAVTSTFAFAGRGILMTTVILVAGFVPCALSGYITMKYLGTLLPAALIIALLADVLLVPALIAKGWIRLKA